MPCRFQLLVYPVTDSDLDRPSYLADPDARFAVELACRVRLLGAG